MDIPSAIDSVQLAARLIQCPSVTPVEGGALALLEGVLGRAGFKCERLLYHTGGSYKVDNLYARLGGGEPNFCFAGHTDVVPPGDESAWKYPPFAAVIQDGFLYGRGTEDMKAAIAAFACAALKLADDCKTIPGSISLLITGDEEGEGVNGTAKVLETLAARGESISACIVGEPTNPAKMGEMVKIGRRGSITAKVLVSGVQGHVAYPHLANNPLTNLVNFLHALQNHKLDDGTEFFQPSNLEITNIDTGNKADNVIPAQASAALNIRFNNLHTAASLRRWMEGVAQSISPYISLEFRVSGEAFLTAKGDLSKITQEAVEKITGRMPELSTTGGTSDARFIKAYCPVVEFGTTGLTAHKVNERVKVDDIYTLEKIYYEILRTFFKL